MHRPSVFRIHEVKFDASSAGQPDMNNLCQVNRDDIEIE
jgi:hypothetical protein